ncbi:MAG: hypothetical protein ABIJ56_14955 [Pseudomonadota bacterium]
MKKSALLIAMLLVLTVSWAARAEAPPFMPIQGVLTDDAGDAIDGATDMVFTLYDAETSGTALWTETQSVMVDEGFFTAYLGDITDLDLALFRDNDELWLGIAVEDDDEMPLVFIGSVAYAGYAEYCGNIPEHDHAFDDLTGTLPSEMLPDGAVVGAQACEDTDKVTGVDADGALLCGDDVDTTIANQACEGTTKVTGVDADGALVCGADIDTDTHINSQACEGTTKVTGVDADGLLVCGADIDTDTNDTYDGTDFALSSQSPCSGNDKVVGVNASGGLICAPDVDTNTHLAGMDFSNADHTTSLTSTAAVIRTITLAAPSAGYAVVNASGYWNFAGSGNDAGRCSITTGTVIDFAQMIAGNDGGFSGTELYMQFAATRGYSVSAGNTTFNLVCDEFTGNVVVGDTSLTAIFVPNRY